jgi:hypothetical protein
MGAWLYEYEDLIAEVLGIDRAEEHVQQGLDLLSSPGGRRSSSFSDMQTNGTPWNRLNEIMRSRGIPDDETISDSESVVSIGELGPDARFSTYDLDQEIADEPEDSFAARQRRKSTGNENTWEVGSPSLMVCAAADDSDFLAHFTRSFSPAKISQRKKPAQIKFRPLATSSCHRPIGRHRLA